MPDPRPRRRAHPRRAGRRGGADDRRASWAPILAEHDGPQIVCAQAGEVNSGAFDPLREIVATCREHGAWCHVDGAFGLWAAASPARRALLDGYAGADSWATDGHKWLNVPYDCGIAIVADTANQRGAMASTADYIPANETDVPWGVESIPEFSRRARAIPLYAALRTLGRDGVTDLVDRCCEHARRIAARLDAAGDDIEILNDVVLNQVLVRFAGDDDIDERGHRSRAARRHVLGRRQPLARRRRHADLRQRLADDGRGRRSLRRRHPRRAARYDGGLTPGPSSSSAGPTMMIVCRSRPCFATVAASSSSRQVMTTSSSGHETRWASPQRAPGA